VHPSPDTLHLQVQGIDNHFAIVVMATTFWFSIGYNFGCVVASDTLFDFKGWFSGSSYPMKA